VGTVTKRVRDGNVSWLARWRDPAGAQRKRSFSKKRDAEDFLAPIEAALRSGQYVDVKNRTTVADYAKAWAAARPHRPTTARRVRSLIDTHLVGTSLGGRRLGDVRPSEVQAWASGRAAVLSPSTLRLLVSLLRSIYASAVLDRLVATSPVVRIQLPRNESVRVVPLTVAQVRALANAMPRRNRAMVVTQAGLGLRIGELLALRVQDVDFLGRSVKVEWQIAPGGRTRTAPKTSRSRRAVPLPQVVADALAAHLMSFPPPEDGSIFATRTGQPYRHDYYGSIIFAKAVSDAGLPTGTTSHDLRHHYASVLLAAGESVIAIADRLGHENAQLVLRTYGHLMSDTEHRTRQAVDEAWRAPSAPPDEASGP
jgi:integrase